MIRSLSTVLLLGCVVPPDLPELDALPYVGPEVTPCAPDRETVAACVIDGDTLDLGACGAERVRMLGVNAPEIAHNASQVADCWGDEAHVAMAEIVEGRRITVTFDRTCLDIYQRTLAYVWLVGDEVDHLRHEPGIERHLYRLGGDTDADALLVNEWVIAQGHGRVYEPEIFGALAYQQRLDLAQAEARERGRGLWGACGAR